MRPLLLALTMLLMPLGAFAWGEHGHLITNEAAFHGLPTDMPVFFYQSASQLTWLGPDPDRWRNAGDSLEAVNPPNHFLDYEYVSHLQLPNDRYAYLDQLYTSGTLRRYAVSNTVIGFLPWTIAELTDLLTVQFRLWRQSVPGSPERLYIERNILRTAGELGHYVADSSNPLHTTLNYNGWILPNPNGYANDCQIHSRFESQFVSHSVAVEQVTPKVSAPVLHTDYFKGSMDFILASNAMTEPLYALDKRGAFRTFGKPSPEGVTFATDRLAAGASLLRDLWWSAWKNSAKSGRRSSGD